MFHLAGRPGAERFDAVREEARVAAAVALRPADELWTLVIVDEPRRRLVAAVDTDGLGWSAWTPQRAEDPCGRTAEEVAPAAAVVVADGASLRSGLVAVDVLDDGSLRVTGADGTVLDGIGTLVDGGDGGDSYNYGPPARDSLVDTPDRVDVSVLERGPLRGALFVVRDYRLPTRLDADGSRSASTEPVSVAMRVELRAHEPFVRLALAWENRSTDHRLRLLVPLGRPPPRLTPRVSWPSFDARSRPRAGRVASSRSRPTRLSGSSMPAAPECCSSGPWSTRSSTSQGAGPGPHAAALHRLPQPQRPSSP